MTQHINTLITLTQPRSPAAEAYRTLRTNLYFSSLDKQLRTLVVTSATPGEGKSLVLANLAVVMAQGEKRTVLVDADLRRPRLHELFGVPNERGLTAMFMAAEALANPPLAPVAGVDGLWLLPSGLLPPNPAELLGSKRMEQVMEALLARADVVLFDAPPVIAVTDAAVLGTKTDGVLLVIDAGQTRRDHAQRAKDLLEKVKVHLVGAVLNNASLDSALGGYYTAG
ncbi:MAG: CpsD/CapB family tyrosine-protein kinase [Thermoflexales bacterium]|nr:CpsD/CapB family tyrosine-protein kinase [Thermoflexales bacterium]